LDCSEVLEQLADYLDEDARQEMCRAIESHLVKCKDCRLQVDTVRKTIVLYQNGTPVEMPARLNEKLAAALSREYGRGEADGR
jgi:predicted anti-sigma-YlaC factor YlaD